MTKTAAAFLMTAERLFQPDTKIYFWTFTFNTVHSDQEGSRLFSDFLNHLRKVLGGDWGGVKVAEIHPKGHGIHFHALINRRLAVDIVRRVAKCHGLGRIHVERAWADKNHPAKTKTFYYWNGSAWVNSETRTITAKTSSEYLAKYLAKQRKGPVSKSGRSVRRWSTFGPIRKTRVKDLANDSPQWVFRREHNLPFTNYRFEMFLNVCWIRGEDVFKSAWYAAQRGDLATVILAKEGKILPDGQFGWKYRFNQRLANAVRPGETPF